ncbi:MAG: DUF2180 family protein [Melioribacteraceae bacterium]|nr:DUF2180 family protein [Melioribacteraceae bacterium]MCF8265040.1 DUF2180 family protein [Melioribacteraceae bacterium]MCF8431654.1 DUF2180 family protein [Melioribacteraceae bacterium]
MKCANHPESDAVGTCVDCGKGLCSECLNQYEFPICDSCNSVRADGEKKELTKNIALTVLFFAIGFYFANSSAGSFQLVGGIVIGYLFAGIPWGWSFLNKITPSIFLFLPLIGWVIYFFIKGILSFFIGFIALPIKLFQIYRDSQRLKGVSQSVNIG